MQTTIWKFKLDVTGEQTIEMPKGAGTLSVQVINNVPFLYAVVDVDAETEPRDFTVYGTGNSFGQDDDSEYKFVGTFAVTKTSVNGNILETFVGHVFELVPLVDEKTDVDTDTDTSLEPESEDAWREFKGTNDYQELLAVLLSRNIFEGYAENILRMAFEAGYNA